MARILALDYGSKRTGIAVSDPLRIIANPLETVSSDQLIPFLTSYCAKENVDTIVIGVPTDLFNRETHGTKGAQLIMEKIKKLFPSLSIVKADERFTSKIAFDSMLSSGISKKKRTNKELVDKLSATIILQSFMAQTT
ncbi:MAG: Holliday junction resolvase RuvX [Bacteroidota bacterium]